MATVLGADTQINYTANCNDFRADPDYAIVQCDLPNEVFPVLHNYTKVRLLFGIGSSIEETGECLVEQGSKLSVHFNRKHWFSKNFDHPAKHFCCMVRR